MSHHSRYAVYFMPRPGGLASFGAHWLGWDAQAGCDIAKLGVADIGSLTEAPHKYGFHGTLKPPFRLAEGCDVAGLDAAMAALAGRTEPAQAEGLALTRLGRFFALTPVGDVSGISRVAAACVTELDAFRAPASAEELARRRKAHLSDRQDALLTAWGYPYVLDQFRFHLTLTGKVPKPQLDAVQAEIQTHLPDLPAPFELADICLCGERGDGRFELLHRYPLCG
ncbi:DUF1045 domain-containing protein [Primorskyibacter sp. 2E107]|uniref:DUF1045 domain-containing protein n=1 Tax=Primorskyibacter sp. 2E107 TaxID=3403458 RepID=UPI003AF87B63